MRDEIINRVQNSSLITLDLEKYFVPGDRVFIDLKPFLFQELILKEKEFRASLSSFNWSQYQDKHVAIGCTADAIIPTWAYMLLTLALKPYAKTIEFGTLENLEVQLFKKAIDEIDWSVYKDSKVVVKGCSKIEVPTEIFIDVAARLKEVASSIMYGEACSTLPLYKRNK